MQIVSVNWESTHTQNEEEEKNNEYIVQRCYSCMCSSFSFTVKNGEYLKNATVISAFSKDELRCEKCGMMRKNDKRRTTTKKYITKPNTERLINVIKNK